MPVGVSRAADRAKAKQCTVCPTTDTHRTAPGAGGLAQRDSHAPGASLREMEQHSEATMCRHAHGKESARYGEASGERPNQHIDQVGLEQAEMMGALST